MWVRHPCGCTTWTERADDLWSMIEDATRAWIGLALTRGDAVPVPSVASLETLRLHMLEKLPCGVPQRARHDGMTVERCVTRPLLTAGVERWDRSGRTAASLRFCAVAVAVCERSPGHGPPTPRASDDQG